MRVLYLLTLSALLALVACGRGGSNNPIPGADELKDSQGNVLVLDVAGLPVQQLTSHPDLIVANNAKRAIESLQNNDLAEGMLSLTAIASMPIDASQMALVSVSMDEVAKVASVAAEAGNENAQYAMQTLNVFLTSQRP